MREFFTFDDVLIEPKFSDIESRQDVDISTELYSLGFLGLPVLSANMDSISSPKMAHAMQKAGGQSVLHRFCTIDENVSALKESLYYGNFPYSLPWVSVGLGDKELDRARALLDAGSTVLVIDVAHGATLAVANQAKALKEMMKDNAAIVVGNFAGTQSVRDFLDRTGYVNGIKIGVGPGSSCSTRIKTGVGVPQLSAIMEIAKLVKTMGIAAIADGGMKTPGDIAKALGAGANAVMLGGMLAGTEECPGIKVYDVWDSFMGETRTIDEQEYKTEPKRYDLKNNGFKKFRGSASKESYEVQGKDTKYRTSEGESFYVPYKGPVGDILQDIEGGLRSAFSYVGARNLSEFHERVEFVKITNAGYVEGTPHGKKN